MKILLIKRGALGDVLMTTPLIRQLKNLSYKIEIDYCVSKSCHTVLKNNKNINELIVLNDSYFTARGIWGFIKFAYSIRNKYDYIFILGKNWIFNLLCNITNSKLIGFARNSISKYLLYKYVIYDDLNRYQGLYYLDLLSKSGLGLVNYNDVIMDLEITSQQKNKIRNKMSDLEIRDYIVVTNSGGNNKFENNGIRMLPQDKFLKLLELLLKNHTVIMVGGDADINNYNLYIKHLGYPKNLISFAGQLKIEESTELLKHARCLYVTDCGVMHLGFIAGIDSKMTCFFGPTNPKHVIPEKTQCKIIWDDADIFDESYQLYGIISNIGTKYFQRLEINEII